MRASRQNIRLALVVAVALLPSLLIGVRVALTPSTSDFLCFWTGSSFVLEGRDPYDETEWARATAGMSADAFGTVRAHNCPGRYAYPLTTAVALVPLGALPLPAAAVAWEIAIFLAAAAGTAMLARAAALDRRVAVVLAVLVASSQPFFQTVLSAQFGGLLLLAAGLLAAREARAGAGALAVLLASLKPHVLLPASLVRVVGTPPRTLLLAAMPAVGLAALSVLLRPAWPFEWLGELTGHRREMFAESVTLWELGGLVGGPFAALSLVAAGIAMPVVAFARDRSRDQLDALAVAAVAWSLVVPYALIGDQTAPLAVASTAVLRRAIAPPVSLPLLAGLFLAAAVLPWLLFGLRYDLGTGQVVSALSPLATSAVLAAALARRR